MAKHLAKITSYKVLCSFVQIGYWSKILPGLFDIISHIQRMMLVLNTAPTLSTVANNTAFLRAASDIESTGTPHKTRQHKPVAGGLHVGKMVIDF